MEELKENNAEEKDEELNNRELTILNLLREFKKGISTMVLMQKANNTRPSNEIVTLRKKGYNIKTYYRKNEKTGSIYGVYKLEEQIEI